MWPRCSRDCGAASLRQQADRVRGIACGALVGFPTNGPGRSDRPQDPNCAVDAPVFVLSVHSASLIDSRLARITQSSGLLMPNVFRAATVGAVCLMSLAHPSPLAAEPEADQASEGTVTIYNLDSAAHTAGVAIDGPIDKNAATHALQLIRFLRPDNDELTVYLNSSGGDVSAAIELGEEVRKLSVLTALDDHGECLGACVLVLAAGVRRSPVPDKVGIYRLPDPKEPSSSRASQKNPGPAKKVQVYLARMGMPDRLYKEMMQRSPDKMLVLDAARLKTFGLDGIDPTYEKWLRENANTERPQQ
jgi:hypothetical protein